MNFGQIAARANPGTVTLSPGATANCATTGGLTRTGTCRAARFDGDVTFLFTLQVQRPTPNRIDLTGPGGATMRVRDFTFSGGPGMLDLGQSGANRRFLRSEEHTSELQSLMRISYAVFCLKKK